MKVWTEYQQCYTGRKDALCICSVEVRSSSGDETFLMERCRSHHPKRSSNSYEVVGGKRSLPRISLTGTNPTSRNTFKVLESRQGKLITVISALVMEFSWGLRMLKPFMGVGGVGARRQSPHPHGRVGDVSVDC